VIIGLSGVARAGKNTVADYLSEHHGYKQVSFADPIRDALYKLNPIVTYSAHENISLQYVVDHEGWEFAKSYTEIRRLLQVFGTEVGREMFGKDIWITKALEGVEFSDRVVVTDVRFPDEAEAIKSLFGEVWRIDRGLPINDHISENALRNWQFDATFDNNGTIPDLTRKVEDYLHLYFTERGQL